MRPLLHPGPYSLYQKWNIVFREAHACNPHCAYFYDTMRALPSSHQGQAFLCDHGATAEPAGRLQSDHDEKAGMQWYFMLQGTVSDTSGAHWRARGGWPDCSLPGIAGFVLYHRCAWSHDFVRETQSLLLVSTGLLCCVHGHLP